VGNRGTALYVDGTLSHSYKKELYVFPRRFCIARSPPKGDFKFNIVYFCRRYCHAGEVTAVDVTSRGRVIVSGSRDRTVGVWALQQDLSPFLVHQVSRQAVSGSQDRTVGVWALQQDRSPFLVHQVSRQAVSGSQDRTVGVWALQQDLSPFLVHQVSRQAVSGSWGRTVGVWALQQDLSPFLVHQVSRQAVSGSWDRTVTMPGSAFLYPNPDYYYWLVFHYCIFRTV
jgi:WD40 repeat protein